MSATSNHIDDDVDHDHIDVDVDHDPINIAGGGVYVVDKPEVTGAAPEPQEV